jgi:hypothetical protein
MMYSAGQEIPYFLELEDSTSHSQKAIIGPILRQSTPSHPMSPRYIFMLSLYVCLCLAVCLFPSDPIFYAFFHFLHVYYMCFAHIDVITPTIWGEVYKLYSFWQCNFLHSHFTSSFLGQNILVHLQFRFFPQRGGERDSHLCETDKSIILYILIFRFVDMKIQDPNWRVANNI